MAEEGHRGSDVTLRGRKAGHAVRGDEIRHLRRGNLLAHRRQARDDAVVEQRHVAAARRFRHLRVMQFGGVFVDVAETQAQALQGLADELLENGLLRRPGGHGVAAQGIQAQPGRGAVIGADQNGHRRQYVLQNGLIVLHVAAVLHAQFGQCAAADHEDVREHAGGDQAAGNRQGVHRAAAEALDIDAGGRLAAAHLGHRLGQIAAAALVAVAHRLFAAVEHVGDVQRVDGFLRQQRAGGQDGGRLAGQVFEQHVGGERGVHLVRGVEAADTSAVAQEQRQGGHVGDKPGAQFGLRYARAQLLQVGRRAQRVGGQRGADGFDEARLQIDQIESVGDFQPTVELLLRHDLAVRREALAAVGVPEPRRRQIAEGVRVDGAEKGLIGGVGHGVGIAAQVGIQGVSHRRVVDDITAWFGAVSHQPGGVGQEESHAPDDRLPDSGQWRVAGGYGGFAGHSPLPTCKESLITFADSSPRGRRTPTLARPVLRGRFFSEASGNPSLDSGLAFFDGGQACIKGGETSINRGEACVNLGEACVNGGEACVNGSEAGIDSGEACIETSIHAPAERDGGDADCSQSHTDADNGPKFRTHPIPPQYSIQLMLVKP